MSAPPGLSRESRVLRLAGMGLMLFVIVVSFVLEESTHSLQRLQSGDRAHLTAIAVLVVAAVNLFALGLALLLAGLRQLSLRRNSRARRGAMARVGAANLLLICFAVTLLDGEGPGGLRGELLDVLRGVPILVAFMLLLHAGIQRFRSGWRYEARSAEEVLAADPRPPVLYLRSFGVDDQLALAARGRWAWLARRFTYTAAVGPEQELAFILEQVGPVVAIGKPGERLPELGAARRYVGDDEWRGVVAGFMADASLVVIRAGETANVWWETEQALTRCPPERVILVALGSPTSLAAFEQRFTATFGTPVPATLLPRSPVFGLLQQLYAKAFTIGKVIFFDPHGTPHEAPLRYLATWWGFFLSPYRPYRDSLQAAFTTVFAALGVRVTAKKTLTAAVLLAFFGGGFGLHHFYMGETRRGVRYLAFCWLGVPMLLGWIDAARLALLDEAQFQARLR
jgi:TM2 domain-containing membrane protein YozV